MANKSKKLNPVVENVKRITFELMDLHLKLEKYSKLHIASHINAALDPTEENVKQAEKLDEKFEGLREHYTYKYVNVRLVTEAVDPAQYRQN